ncbi:MAG: OmpA family protein [Agarilytica sp.]
MIRRQTLEPKINHERWLVSYADFITLLFAFFVVMYSVSHVNEQKYRQLSTTLESAFSSTSSERKVVDESVQIAEPVLAEIEDIAEDIQESLGGVLSDDAISISGNEQWVDIELSAGLLFSSGEAELSNAAKKVLSPVAEILAPYENAVAIAGHTDDVPINNVAFASNWSLSSARAVSVVNFLAFAGVKPGRLSAVGYGEYRPVVANTDSDSRARNRRVVIRIAKESAPANLVPVDEFTGTRVPDASVDEAQDLNSTGVDENLDSGLSNSGNSEAEAAQENPPDTPLQTDPILSENLQPVRLQGGGLLFTSDPELPRTNPPVTEQAPQEQEGQ